MYENISKKVSDVLGTIPSRSGCGGKSRQYAYQTVEVRRTGNHEIRVPSARWRLLHGGI